MATKEQQQPQQQHYLFVSPSRAFFACVLSICILLDLCVPVRGSYSVCKLCSCSLDCHLRLDCLCSLIATLTPCVRFACSLQRLYSCACTHQRFDFATALPLCALCVLLINSALLLSLLLHLCKDTFAHVLLFRSLARFHFWAPACFVYARWRTLTFSEAL